MIIFDYHDDSGSYVVVNVNINAISKGDHKIVVKTVLKCILKIAFRSLKASKSINNPKRNQFYDAKHLKKNVIDVHLMRFLEA